MNRVKPSDIKKIKVVCWITRDVHTPNYRLKGHANDQNKIIKTYIEGTSHVNN